MTPVEAPRVVSPLMWPRFTTRSERRLNARLLQRGLAGELDRARPPIGITTIPLVADLIGKLAVERWVYYCVDDLAEWPGLDRDTLLGMERDLVEKVDEIIVVSEPLARRMESMGRQSTILTHGVELEHWRPPSAVPVDTAGRSGGNVVFWGVVDQRLDVVWIEALAERVEARVLLLGPHNNPDPRLAEIDGVELPGPVPYDALPRIAAEAGVLIMPYGQSPATRAMQPLKLKEYLATNRPVVVADLPAVSEWSDACDVVPDAGSFAARVIERMETGPPASQIFARRRLEHESWEAKASRFERLVVEGGGG